MGKFKEFIKARLDEKIINEASEIKFDELKQEDKDFIKKNKLDKSIDQIFDGIHGNIIMLNDDNRLDKNDLKKLISDKKFRWLDATSIGF